MRIPGQHLDTVVYQPILEFSVHVFALARWQHHEDSQTSRQAPLWAVLKYAK